MNMRIILLIGLFLISGCRSNKQIQKLNAHLERQDIVHEKIESKPVTIFIHGTLPPIAERLVHAYDVPLGLHKAGALSTTLLMGKIPFLLSEADPQQFSFETFYLFGWSGDLSFVSRKKEAYDLYYALKQLDNKGPITLICHSHGCNLALNLALIVEEMKDTQFKVDRLILLAGPVQKETEHFIRSPIFTKIYSLYSPIDLIQVLDPQGLYKDQKNKENIPLFSQRLFPATHNLIQAEVKKGRQGKRGLLHIEFILADFIKRLPSVLKMLDQEAEKIKNAADTTHFVIDLKKMMVTIKK
ncbi:MAG: hypothetical protein WA432_03925 [Candidatus Babeliaceae bacterium]